jgi:hypothetical protein
MKMLMLTLPFMVHDLIATEVIVCTGLYFVVLYCSRYILVYTRLNSSTQQSTRPGQAPVFIACRMSLIPVTRWWKC